MFTPDRRIHLDHKITDHYKHCIDQFGSSPKGVSWKDDQAQWIRFEQIARVITREEFTINDFGCGTGRLYEFLKTKNYRPHYYGYDIMDEMISLSQKNLLPNSNVTLLKIESASEMIESDYSAVSGTFNLKFDATETEWLEYVENTLITINNKSRLGFAFNLLTSYSDKELMRPHLYYADPLHFFDFCKRAFSKNVALLHDYDQYDFTIIVRKG